MAHAAVRFRPAVENLEDRRLPTSTRILLDFTPDTGLPSLSGPILPGDFADSFRFTDFRGFAPAFLDFNRRHSEEDR